MKKGGLYDRSIRTVSVVYLAIGVAILILTLTRGGGVLSLGFLLGLAFIGVGLARYRLQQKIGSEE
jgi:hypothetical protein